MTNYNMDPNYMLRKQKILNDSKVQQSTNQSSTAVKPQQGPSFQEVLDKVSQKELKFSKHAIQRLQSRNIELTSSEIDQINKAVEKADEKGVKEALILMDNKAFIASVKNKTIITASTEEQLKENVFTNIDGAVIV